MPGVNDHIFTLHSLPFTLLNRHNGAQAGRCPARADHRFLLLLIVVHDLIVRIDHIRAGGAAALGTAHIGAGAGLAGLRPILEEGGLPPDLAPLPLLSLLWECGRLTEGQIRIHAT